MHGVGARWNWLLFFRRKIGKFPVVFVRCEVEKCSNYSGKSVRGVRNSRYVCHFRGLALRYKVFFLFALWTRSPSVLLQQTDRFFPLPIKLHQPEAVPTYNARCTGFMRCGIFFSLLRYAHLFPFICVWDARRPLLRECIWIWLAFLAARLCGVSNEFINQAAISPSRFEKEENVNAFEIDLWEVVNQQTGGCSEFLVTDPGF